MSGPMHLAIFALLAAGAPAASRAKIARCMGPDMSRLKLHGDGEIDTGLLQLLDAPDCRAVHLDVLEQDRADVLAHQQAGLGRLMKRAVLENEVSQGVLA